MRVERKAVGPGDLSAYYSRYNRSNARFLDATGDEHRDVFDARYSGTVGPRRLGRGDDVSVGACRHQDDRRVGGRLAGGLYVASLPWTPRVVLQVDAASGDPHPGDGRVGTFNPLFPNGYYFALAGYTGYANLIHVKPSLITLKPTSKLSLLAALASSGARPTADAVYQQGWPWCPARRDMARAGRAFLCPVARRLGIAANLRRVEAVHFQVGPSIRNSAA